jgi:GGDEF domain-containing protein
MNNDRAKPWERYSAAVGMAEMASDDRTVDLVFRRAEKAMYEDKQRIKEGHASYR